MKKITIIEQTNFLEIRIKKMIEKYELGEVITYKHENFTKIKLKSQLKNVKVFIVDLDYNNIEPKVFIKKVRKFSHSQAKILALTNSSDVKFLKTMIYFGCDDFILKPFNDRKLVLKLKRNISDNIDNNFYKDFTFTNDYIDEVSDIDLKWFKDYSIGVKEIDMEHKSLVGVYQKLYNLMRQGKGFDYYNEIIDFLNKYIDEHFANEEKLQKKIGYNLYEEHCNIHKNFKKTVKKIISENNSEHIDNKVLIKINLFLKDWLMHHILIEDNKIGEFIKKNNYK